MTYRLLISVITLGKQCPFTLYVNSTPISMSQQVKCLHLIKIPMFESHLQMKTLGVTVVCYIATFWSMFDHIYQDNTIEL